MAKLFDISPKELLSGGKHTKTVKARSVVCYWGNREFGMSTIELSKKMNISQPTASQFVVRCQKIAHTEKLAFLELHNLYSNGRPKNPLNKNAIKPAVMSLIIGISYIIRIGVFSAKIQWCSTKR